MIDMKLKTMQLNPIKLHPLKLQLTHQHKFTTSLTGVLPDAGNQPDPTPDKLQHYKENAEEIVEDVVKSNLKKHQSDTLHGSRSLQMLLGKHFTRDVNDWDIFSTTEKKRALQLEKQLDKRAGCDIFQTRYQHITKVSAGEDDPYTGEHLYIVESPSVHNDPTVDVMSHPKNLPRTRRKSIYHEALPVAYQKARTRVYRSPLQAGKATHDYRAIEAYYKSQGKKLR